MEIVEVTVGLVVCLGLAVFAIAALAAEMPRARTEATLAEWCATLGVDRPRSWTTRCPRLLRAYRETLPMPTRRAFFTGLRVAPDQAQTVPGCAPYAPSDLIATVRD
jgi:hypothetical protein